MNNSAYLKDYVRMHPDNRMAWYLLGKEYEQNGQEGKANYCYIQAGDIYEAFEASKTPDEVWKEYAAELLEASKRKARSRTRWKRGLAALMLLLLILLSPHWTAAPSGGQSADESSQGKQNQTEAAVPTAGAGAASPGQSQPKGPLFTAAAAETPEERAQAMAALLTPREKTRKQTGLLGMRSQNGWLLWSRNMPLEFSAVQDAAAGSATVQALNPASCGCEPPDEPDIKQLKHQAAGWIEEQELLAVLSSAIVRYKEASGHFPAKAGELNQPYPDNWIAGDMPGLAPAFDTALAQVENKQLPSAGEKPGRTEGIPGQAAAKPGEPFFEQPLEIKVDKDKHLLALVSGKVVLRVYKVGLGGGRTPEGTFRITEKVINPNGHDNGEFGSRGMALSGGNYAIHGTNEPDSVGKDESQGCVRMARADVEELFDLVPKGTPVTIGKGILPDLQPGSSERFEFPDRQDQTNPHKTYHWLG